MAWTPSGLSTALAVTDQGVSQPIQLSAFQCRVYNAGPSDCRIRYTNAPQTPDDYDMIVPAGLLEVHGKVGAGFVNAKTKTGETTTLHIMPGSGD